jgi:hypothetical protein
MNLEMTAIKHNSSPSLEDPSHAGGEFGRKQPKRETESAQDMVHEVEISNQGDCRTDGPLMRSRVHNRRKQEPYLTDTGTGREENRRMAAQDQGVNDCGFRCPNCGLRRVIVDDRLLTLIFEMETPGIFPVCCPECGTQHEFTCEDLKVF